MFFFSSFSQRGIVCCLKSSDNLVSLGVNLNQCMDPQRNAGNLPGRVRRKKSKFLAPFHREYSVRYSLLCFRQELGHSI